jgi:DNA-binding LacI/PurR family transcriptional regulator
LDEVTSFAQRIAGIEQAAQEAGVGMPARIVAGDLSLPPNEYEAAAYRAMQGYLESGARPDALFALFDPMAYGALRALREAGRSVPEEVAVIGHDDLPMSGYFNPALASIHQPVEALAERAVALLLERIGQGGLDGQKPSRVFLEPSLVARQSCAHTVVRARQSCGRRGISHTSSRGDD